MTLCSDAAMVLYYDIDGDNADHDDWHTYEHLHERLSIPGFLRATRWIATDAAPKYLVVYEVDSTAIATSPDYLARLNNPTSWTSSMMERFRGMIRGFGAVVASAGFGLGHAMVSLRLTPADGHEAAMAARLADILPAMASRRGMAGVYLLRPDAAPPMTKEQAIRGPDAQLPWLLLASAYDRAALDQAVAEHLSAGILERSGAAPGIVRGDYALHYTATAQEVARSAANPPLDPAQRQSTGARR